MSKLTVVMTDDRSFTLNSELTLGNSYEVLGTAMNEENEELYTVKNDMGQLHSYAAKRFTPAVNEEEE